MTDPTLEYFRSLASQMLNPERVPEDWQWEGRYMSQRMFGITEARAKEMAAQWGGTASKMGDR